jgi:D-3-phosphoglycerate dehydrogenase
MTMAVMLSAPYMLPSVERFRPLFAAFEIELIVPKVVERLEEDELLAYAGQFDGAMCGDDRFTARVLERCAPRLKIISKWGTGIDSIDKQAAARLGIEVRNTPDAFTDAVADSVMSYILAFARLTPWMDAEMKQGKWSKMVGRSLAECTLGIIGVGRIGKAVALRAKAFGMRLLGNDIVAMPADFLSRSGINMVVLDDLLAEADFISLNCDLNPTSHHLIDSSALGKTKSGAVLINAARGPLVDQDAMVAALQSGGLAGAGLDVFEIEPLPKDSPLREFNNVLLSPHNANSSPSAWERVHWNTIRNLFEGLGLDTPKLKEEDYPPLG